MGFNLGMWRFKKFTSPYYKMVAALILLTLLFETDAADSANGLPDLKTIPTPPSFKHEPNPPIMYFAVDPADSKSRSEDSANVDSLKERRLVCEAEGYPEPICKWLKDDRPLAEDSDGRITQQQGVGTVTISRLKVEDEGKYQCYCENDNGTAYDRPIELKRAYVGFFPTPKIETINIGLGAPFSRSCVAPVSVPPARVFWIYKDAGKGGSHAAFNTINSSHIAMNDKGAIFFQYVKEDTNQPDLYFTCGVENMELKDYKFGDQFRFNVTIQPGQRLSYIPPRELYVSPNDISVLRTGTLELYCVYSGYPDTKPTWRKINGAPIDWTRVTWSTNYNKSLKIENVKSEDEGTYECIVDQGRRKTFKVTVDAAPYWVTSPPHSINSSEGETVEFDCNAAGRPKPEFKFYKNGKELQSDNYHIFIDGSKLRIVNLRKGDDGDGDNAVYQCKASNAHGFIWANFYLNLLSFRPVLLDGPGDLTTVSGKDVTLACKFFGSPRSIVTWRLPKTLIESRSQNPVDHHGIARLPLYNVGTEHEGIYECYAENRHGNASGRGSLTVRKPTRLIDFPKNSTIIAGETLRLPCKAIPDPNLNLKVTWLWYGVPIDTANGRYVVEADNSLRIDGAVGADTGEYTCAAETEYDRTERVAKIIVKDVPSSPQIVYVTCDTKSAALDFVYVETLQHEPAREFWAQKNVDADVEPDIWETHPTPVSQLDSTGHGSVRVNLHPYGNFSFRVFARNDVGDSAPTLGDKRCATSPSKPEKNPAKVFVKGNTPEDVTVYWEPMPRRDWNGPKFHYIVQYNRIGEEPQNITVEDPDRSSVVIPVDRPFEEYEVMVRARNAEGDSTAAPAKFRGRSGEEKPKRAPTGFDYHQPRSEQPTVVTFVWDKYDAGDFKGELKGFKIEHWVHTNKRAEPIRKVALFDPAATRGNVYDMKPYSINKARILAYSGGGDGPPSDERTITMPEGFPTPVQNLEAFALSSNEVGVVWQLPRELNGILKGYNVSWCRIESGTAGYGVDFPSCRVLGNIIQTNYYRIPFLESNVEYRVEVAALTGPGSGDPNSRDVRTLPLDVPHGEPEPPSVHEAGIGENHINVTWIPGTFNPEDRKPLGNDHYIEYRPKGQEQWIQVPHREKNFTVQIDGLQPGTTYEVRSVSVVNATPLNLESRSNIVELTTAGEAPSATAGWLIAIIVAIIILIIILIIVCVVVRNRGAKYAVSEKEKEQGRGHPASKEGFGEYGRVDKDEEKRSLTAESKAESETDSMGEYGDGETQRFTEDGSFIGEYGAPNKVIGVPSAVTRPGGKPKGGQTNLSTDV